MFYMTPQIEFTISNATQVDFIESGMSSLDLVEKTKFTANSDNQELALSPKAIGSSIQKLELNNESIYCEGLSYLASDTSLKFKMQGSMQSVAKGSGLYLQHISGSGKIYLETYGSIIEKRISDEEPIIVDYGHLVAFESSLEYKLLKPKRGTINSTTIGEWIVIKFSGNGRIWLQSRNRGENAQLLKKYID
ncbi:MAG: hypothetical protein Kapaf2KO_10750 [Candidatus Kapaibacteriales bacterium]